MGSDSERASVGSRASWTGARLLAIVLIIITVVSTGGAGLYYYVLRPVGSSNQPCSNGATNPPSCITCASGSTITAGACHANCSNGATNPPSCNTYPPCSNGGTNPPTCTPPCTNGASNPPTCDEYPTKVTLSCNPSTIESRITNSSCSVDVSSTYEAPPAERVDFDCQPYSTAGLPECIISTPSNDVCRLAPTAIPDVSSCDFTVEATGPSLTVYVLYPGIQFAGSGGLESSIGNFNFTVIQPPSAVVVSGTVKTTTIGTTVSGITFTSTSQTYRGITRSGSYNATLPNFQTYSVTIYYTTVTGTSGNCNAGTLNLANASRSLTINYQC